MLTPRTLVARYTALRGKVFERLGKVTSITEQGTLDAGKRLDNVVAVARAHISSLRDLLVGATDSSLQVAIGTHADDLRQHCGALEIAVTAHVNEVRSVAECARQIKVSAQEIERANSAARVLSINARIESSRAGATVFKAISVEMGELSRAISSANAKIQQLASSLEVTLP
ncbi:MAG TPA: hypothetical protein VGC41_03620, partial [Kofleriaceae bacterium]